ncbi:hypothetical protein AMIS_67170 [Actinoplanes missouriensis 431]|uniref:CopG family transcriptional regulator n=1 Tax=Actinoplanes missouriensis (strain ATCC 14538 / DSM 43046 / CBS 188.64 / JCM 3121 / NBRC 102363 / NCIMB 12654 / NRRL B-3342 / UNCC 431) TaxID=512565 RepID=I0HG00_ACTM4|nr:hypothetical protein [Actinoplanes missouriensis]BAL91937.1 hypothetical protein AMIS_67170 [Actinoplanes missouriensis 431]
MSRVFVTLDLDDEVYATAKERAHAELVSAETWIAYRLEQHINMNRLRNSDRSDAPGENAGKQHA